MIIVKLQGGLGNQMFQYAFGLSMSQKLKSKLYFDDHFFRSDKSDMQIAQRNFELGVFDIDIPIASDTIINTFTAPNKLQRVANKFNIGAKHIFQETSLKFDQAVFDTTGAAYFDGYWQSEQYFKGGEALIREAFKFNSTLNSQSQKIAAKIGAEQNTIAVHIRRGDYVSSAGTNKLHGTCSKLYYSNAIELIGARISNPQYYLFSDDPEWTKLNLLPLIKGATIIAHNGNGDSWQDMALMSKCNHQVIANSSFSWWGAWMNTNKDKLVIAPKKWFKTPDFYFDDIDIIPQNWIRLPDA